MSQGKIAVIMGSDSDLPTMQAGIDTLKEFDMEFDVKVVSAHRTPKAMLEFAESARDNGYRVIIAAAGGAAHLPGMVASATTLPVIGVPVNITALDGMDSLLSIVQMPKGVPVATVGIDNSTNAALLAIKILALTDADLNEKLNHHSKQQQDKVAQANNKLANKLKS